MPLFMFVSGYFFYSSIQKRTFFEFLQKLICQIIVPLLSFCCISFLISRFEEIHILGTIQLIKLALCHILYSLWFLWAVLYCSITLWLCHKVKIDIVWIQILIIAILYCVPDVLNTCYFKYLYPFFFAGYLSRKDNALNYIHNVEWKIGVVSFGLYFLLILTLFTKDTYIYTSKIYIFRGDGVGFHIYNDALRLLVGFIGVIGCVSLLKAIFGINANHRLISRLADIGTKSMGIYCFQDLFVRYIPQITPQLPSILTCILTFVGLFVVSYSATAICNRYRFLNTIFCGSRNAPH